MTTYRNWMYQRIGPDGIPTDDFKAGVREFIEFAVGNPSHMDGSKIKCPCKAKKCQNYNFLEPHVVENHLWRRGFVKDYLCWYSQGETFMLGSYSQDYGERNVYEQGASTSQHVERAYSNEGEPITSSPDMERSEHVENAYSDEDDPITSSPDDSPPNEPELPNQDAQRFFDKMEDCKEPVFDGCEVSLLSLVSRMTKLKVAASMSEAHYDEMAGIINDMIPKENIMPDTFYETKKLVNSLGLPHQKIDACKEGCMIYWGKDAARKKCKFCKFPRCKSKRSRVAHSVMWYFPLTSRLKRLYLSNATAKHMTWHSRHRSDPGTMVHPSDSEAWKHFDRTNQEFADEPRNIRLGLCTDGFMPFGQYSKQYSSWPVILTPYNLPPGMCMKEEFMFLTAIVPGPTDPKQRIDVFLQPLIAELNELWGIGTEAFDSFRQQNFRLRAALMWTISDFPAYSMFSGWPTQGRLACPHCMQSTDAFTLPNGGKQSWFDNHRKFLPLKHPFRRDKKHFKAGEIVTKEAPPLLSGAEILQWIDDLGLMKVTEPGYLENNEWIHKNSDCGWKKRSIFWDLPYWSTNLIRHNLDVMHIEKNCFENVINTIMNVKGKTKDNDKSRADLRNICDRPELDVNDSGVYEQGKYSLKKPGLEVLCDWVMNLKFPDGCVSNLSRCVDTNTNQFSRMKSHDCHVFMQKLIPIAFRDLLSDSVWQAITEFSLFFSQLTCTTLRVEDMRRLEQEIPVILCKLEQIFPPSFFDSMEHLTVHLPYEARIAGPVQYRWMYPFERYLKHLKKTVGNRARVEGSIGNAYLTEETSNFGLHYFEPDVYTQHRKVGRNDDGGEKTAIPGNLSIFSYPIRLSGKCFRKTLTEEEYNSARAYILLSCREVQQYVLIFKKHLQDYDLAPTEADVNACLEKDFPHWFERYVSTMCFDLLSTFLINFKNSTCHITRISHFLTT